MNQEAHVAVAQLQQEIEGYLGGLESNSIIFDFAENDGKHQLDLVTVNPKHRESFLFHTSRGLSKVEALKNMLDYVQDYKEKESSFTIQWTLRGSEDLQTSYFRSQNIMSALEKFYFGRDINSIVVFSATLNPIA